MRLVSSALVRSSKPAERGEDRTVSLRTANGCGPDDMTGDDPEGADRLICNERGQGSARINVSWVNRELTRDGRTTAAGRERASLTTKDTRQEAEQRPKRWVTRCALVCGWWTVRGGSAGSPLGKGESGTVHRGRSQEKGGTERGELDHPSLGLERVDLCRPPSPSSSLGYFAMIRNPLTSASRSNSLGGTKNVRECKSPIVRTTDMR